MAHKGNYTVKGKGRAVHLSGGTYKSTGGAVTRRVMRRLHKPSSRNK